MAQRLDPAIARDGINGFSLPLLRRRSGGLQQGPAIASLATAPHSRARRARICRYGQLGDSRAGGVSRSSRPRAKRAVHWVGSTRSVLVWREPPTPCRLACALEVVATAARSGSTTPRVRIDPNTLSRSHCHQHATDNQTCNGLSIDLVQNVGQAASLGIVADAPMNGAAQRSSVRH